MYVTVRDSEVRSCGKVEVDVLGPPSDITALADWA